VARPRSRTDDARATAGATGAGLTAGRGMALRAEGGGGGSSAATG